jgi:outer membrane murein-binding lipoprotein Lpp
MNASIMTTYDFIAWLLPFLVVVVGQVYSWYDNRTKMAQTDTKVEQVGHALNGRLAELIEATRAAAYAKGMADATAKERATAVDLLAAPPTAEIARLQAENAVSITDRADLHAQVNAVRTEGEGAGHP